LAAAGLPWSLCACNPNHLKPEGSNTMSTTLQVENGKNYIFELKSGGQVWAYKKGTSNRDLIDQNAQTRCIAADPDTDNVFLMHRVGSIYHFNWGTKAWDAIDQSGHARQITAGNGMVYQAHDTSIWRFDWASRTWHVIDQQPLTSGILAVHDRLFQIHKTGAIWKFDPPSASWHCVESNPHGNTIAISYAGDRLYQLHNTGSIWCLDESTGGWFVVDASPNAIWIASDGPQIYQMHKNGSVWRLEGREWRPDHQVSEPGATSAFLDNLITTGTKIYQETCKEQITDFRLASVAAEASCHIPHLAPMCLPSRAFQLWTAKEVVECIKDAVSEDEKRTIDERPGWTGADDVDYDRDAVRDRMDRLERPHREP
jgi:hypothetical protein